MPKRTEKAIFVYNLSNLEKIKIGDYDLVYLGSEFCSRHILPLKKLSKALWWLDTNGKRFVFVTPLVTDQDMIKIDRILSYIHKNYAPCEIVVNDFGLLNLIKKKYGSFILTAGRVIVALLAYPDYQILNKKSALDFLKANGIRKIEINYRPSLPLLSQNHGVEISLRYPFFPIASTRFCPSIMNYRNLNDPCCRKCNDGIITLRHPFVGDKIYLKGNTYFLKYNSGLKRLGGLKISRLVIQPEI